MADASLLDYIQTRVASRATRGAPARWEGTSVQLAAKAWRLSQRRIAKRRTKVRHLWDLRWHGANQAIANRALADILGVCPLPHCSRTHIFCNCPGIAAERTGLNHHLGLLVDCIPTGPGRALGRAIHNMHFQLPNVANRGQLWTGLWSPRHRAVLSPYLLLCTLKEEQKINLNISTWTTAGVAKLWTTSPTGNPYPHYPHPSRSPRSLESDLDRSHPRGWATPLTHPQNRPLRLYGRPGLPATPLGTTPPHQRQHQRYCDPALPAPPGLTRWTRTTDDTLSSAPVPRRTTLSNPGACRNAQCGDHCLC